MRPYHIRYMIAAAAVSVTATVLLLKISGNLSSSPLQLTQVSTAQQQDSMSTNPSLIISCRDGMSWLSGKNASNLLITDSQGQAIQCVE